MYVQAKGERGFLPWLEKNMGTERDKGPDWSMVDDSLYACVGEMSVYLSVCTVQPTVCIRGSQYACIGGVYACLSA